MPITLEYDPEVDGALIFFREVERDDQKFTREVWPADFGGDVGFLLDDEGRLVGIEILWASKYLDKQLLDDATEPQDSEDSGER